ncbi:DMT family transporter [Micromonospora chersina]|uniref:DMT family transporter n=1 Tax=Micromonospora chersina TaxID=47854 RepID=UPI0037195A49
MQPATRHIAAVLAASVLWGTTGVVAQQAPAGSDQMLVGLSTFGFGGLLLFALGPRAASGVLRARRSWLLLGMGALGVIAYASMYYWSMSLIGVAIGNVLALGSGPVFAGLLELIVERRPVRGGWAAATATAVVGIALLASSAMQETGSHPILGVVLGLGAGLGYALYSWCGARLIAHGDPSRGVMAGIFTLASLVLVPWFLLATPGPLVRHPSGLIVLAYLALLPMAIAYLLFGYGLQGLAASTATTLALAEPFVATTLATILLDEQLSRDAWIGLALILIGIVIIVVTERRQEHRPQSALQA